MIPIVLEQLLHVNRDLKMIFSQDSRGKISFLHIDVRATIQTANEWRHQRSMGQVKEQHIGTILAGAPGILSMAFNPLKRTIGQQAEIVLLANDADVPAINLFITDLLHTEVPVRQLFDDLSRPMHPSSRVDKALKRAIAELTEYATGEYQKD